ncbi:MAG TPA: hypothetical protein VH858_17185 [Hyphomicrobiales bacterium]|jgi:hypothetical protein
MSIIVDLPRWQMGGACARPIEPDEPGTGLPSGGKARSPDGAEIILFPRPQRTAAKRIRKPLKRRFAIREQRAALERNER